MRSFLLLAILFVLCAPPGAPAPPVLPSLTVSLSPIDVQLNGSERAQQVIFKGTVDVEASPFTSMHVDLNGTTSNGWQAECEPKSFDFGGSGSEDFTFRVTVPANVTAQNPHIEESVTVLGRGQTMFLVLEHTATATIYISGRPANASTTPDGSPPSRPVVTAASSPAGIGPGAPVAAVAVLIASAAVGYLALRRRHGRLVGLRH